MDGDSASSPSSSSKKGKASRKRGTKLSAIRMLEKNYERKSDLKERELQLKAEELELQRRKFNAEVNERKEKLKLVMEERRMFFKFLEGLVVIHWLSIVTVVVFVTQGQVV